MFNLSYVQLKNFPRTFINVFLYDKKGLLKNLRGGSVYIRFLIAIKNIFFTKIQVCVQFLEIK